MKARKAGKWRDVEAQRPQAVDVPFGTSGELWGGQCGWGGAEAQRGHLTHILFGVSEEFRFEKRD